MIDQPAVPAPSLEQEKRTVIKIYGLLWLILVLCFLPGSAAIILVVLLVTALPPVLGGLRHKAADDSLTANHLTYMIRTIWIVGGLTGITVIAAVFYISNSYNQGNFDISPLMPCLSEIAKTTDSVVNATTQILETKCVDDLLSANAHTLNVARIIAEGPFLLYLVLRLLKGLARARKNERIANPKSWF